MQSYIWLAHIWSERLIILVPLPAVRQYHPIPEPEETRNMQERL